MKQIILFTIGLLSFNSLAQPSNDDCVGATTVVDDGTCITGTTVNAADNWTNLVGCQSGAPGSDHEDVWYSFTASNSVLTVDVTQGLGWAGDLEVSIWEPDPILGCAGLFTELASNCGASPVQVTATGLTPGNTYYITVSNEASGTTGEFDICTLTTAPPAGCTDNDDCSTAAAVALPASGSGPLCFTDCNTGAAPGIDFVGNNCADQMGPTVWYSFTTDATHSSLDVTLTSSDFSTPEFTIWENTCNPWTQLVGTCTEGSGGSATLTAYTGLTENTTYLIAISDVGGGEGTFDLCLEQFPDDSPCNTNSAVTETGSSDPATPIGGPYSPGEVVSFCYNITDWDTGPTCNYLQGIVPSFGCGWDPSSFDANGMPLAITTPLVTAGVIDIPNGPPTVYDPCDGQSAGTWSWYTAGQVSYNNINAVFGTPGALPDGTPMPAGWYFTSSYDPVAGNCNDVTDVNLAYGDNSFPNCDNTLDWNVCFDLTVGPVANCGTACEDLSVSIQTYADGEIGVWNSLGCIGNLPQTHYATLECCPVFLNPGPQISCDTYTFPAITGSLLTGNEAYYTGPGGTGTQYNAGDVVNFGDFVGYPVTIYIFDGTSCATEISFDLTINETPIADAPVDVAACDTYTLPALTVGNYFSSTGGVGPIAVGTNITSTQTIFVYAETGTTPNCADENSFVVTINTITADAPADVTACDTYTLPALTVGNYFSATGGVGPIAVGTNITSTQTIFVYAETGTTPNCTDENSFIVTINPTPVADAPVDVTACDTYTLPALTVGNYFSAPGGVGPIAVGTNITSTQTIYVYAETGTIPNCTDENSFVVTINSTPVADAPVDVSACDSYTLPALTVGNYFSATGGVGPIAVGTNITSTQTIFVYAETGTTPNCTDENSFTVTINPTPVADAPANVTACDTYTLPALTVGNYFSTTGGVGPIAVGTNITSTQTIFVYAETGTTPNCTDENSFIVTINPTPVADAPADVTACDNYLLPALTVGNYFSATGGVGPIAVGTNITSTQTIFIYAETGTTPNCTDENSFTVTINPTPVADAPADVTACDTYTLPALTVGNYFSATGGVGPIAVGTNITSTQTIFVYAETGTTPNCTDENSFTVTINPTPVADAPADVVECDTYTLPALVVGDYYTGTGGTGIMLNAGDAITSTQTIFVYAETGTIPNCTDENSFVVTINNTPVATDLTPSVCEDAPAGSGQSAGIDLTTNNPNINGGGGLTFTWFTDPLATTPVLDETNETVSNGEVFYVVVDNGFCTDTAIVTYSVTATITLWDPATVLCENPVGSGTYTGFDLTSINTAVYVGSGSETFTWYESDMTTLVVTPTNVTVSSATTYWVEVTDGNCMNGIMVTFTVNPYPVADAPVDVSACDTYTLPALVVGDYYTGSGGTGVMLNAGDAITSTQTIFVYAETGTTPNCTDENSFTITINPTPVADAPVDITACDTYTLPALTVGNYFSATGGVGPIAVGTNITSTQTIFVYAETGTTPNCTDENSFTVTINPTPVADAPIDVTACDTYTLPALTVGNYFSAPGGVGPIAVGTNITSTQTIYVYAETGTTPNCTDENSFVVTINPSPVADAPADVTACDTYTLPALTVGNYFSATGGVGPIAVGTNITSTQTIFVYAETGTTPNCTDENSFTVTINPTPVADAPVNVTACDTYTLPALTVGNYFSATGGVGPIAVGTNITSTQTIFVYAETGTTPNCTDENSFTVTINPTPVADAPADVTACDNYLLPALTVGNYFSSPGGVGPIAVGANITSTQTIYVYAETGTTPNCTDENTFTVTINPTPVADAPADVTACDTYTLPALTVGNYFSGSGGTGTAMNAGDVISSTQTVYVYAETGTIPNCSNENSFVVTISPTPVADAPTDVTACNTYTLPALTVGNYFTGIGGTGTAMNAGDVISSTQTIYVYAETGTTPNCSDENNFVVTISPTPVADAPADVESCDSYTLPALTVGNYFTGAGGTGTAMNAGDVITSTQTIYVYAETGTVPNCSDENSFIVTINATPVADAPINVTACDTYTLPVLTVGDYFTGTGGTGTALNAGDAITSTQTIYVYAETGTTPNCSDENSFIVTIDQAEDATFTLTDFCEGDVNSASITGTTGGIFSFDPDLSDGAIVDASTGEITNGVGGTTYGIQYLTSGTCPDSLTLQVTAHAVPNAPILSADMLFCSGIDYDAMTASGGTGVMTWYDDASLTGILSTGSSFVPLDLEGFTTYYVTETSAFGCEGPESMVTIEIVPCELIIPTAITPGQLPNDVWEIVNLDAAYPDNIVSIYNRWGNLIFEHASDPNNPYSLNPWKGTTLNGDELPVASYYYIIQYNDGSGDGANGTVTIIKNK